MNIISAFPGKLLMGFLLLLFTLTPNLSRSQILPPPYNVEAYFNNDIVPIVDVFWDHDNDTNLYFIVERDSLPIGTTTEHYYIDYPPDFLNYCYTVLAVYNPGTSEPGGPACTLTQLYPEMEVSPVWIEDYIPMNDSVGWPVGVLNIGEAVLWYEVVGFTGSTSPPGFISIDDWASTYVSPNGGLINIPVIWKSSGYAPGTYYQDLVIISTDPDNPVEILPNIMHVGQYCWYWGQIRDAFTLEPIFGAEVNSGNHHVLTDTIGNYSIGLLINSTIDLTISKPGYEPINLQVNTGDQYTVTELDTSLQPLSLGLNWVIADVDCNDPAPSEISWSMPENLGELLYDNDFCTDFFAWEEAQGEHAVKFTPTGYPAIIYGGKFYVGRGVYPVGDWLNSTVSVLVYDEGPDGNPATVLDSTWASITDYEWVSFYGLDAQIDSGNFFISIVQPDSLPDTPPIGIDELTTFDNFSYSKPPGGNWDTASYRNFMIRAEIQYESENNVSGYVISRASDFDPNLGPTAGTILILDTITELNYIDNSFEFVEEDWYAYAVKPLYMSGQSGPGVYSNIIGHDLGKVVEFQAEDCNGNTIDSVEVMMLGMDYPYAMYYGMPPDTTWSYFGFDCVWKGYYSLTITKQGFEPITFDTHILNDTIFYIIFDTTQYAPQNIWVDTISTTAYWDIPPDTADVLDYSVYLDGLYQANTDSTFYQFSGLPFNQYTVCVEANYACGPSDSACTSFGGGYLLAPDWLTGDSIGMDVLLTWYMDTTGVAGEILGYMLYRDSSYIKYIPYVIIQDTCFYLDTSLQPICYQYHVSTLYDLTNYGYPGHMKESQYTSPEEVCLVFGTILPVFEDWSSGTFGSIWTAEDNWIVNGQFGNPYPTAEFKWDPVMTDYNAYLTSEPINGVYLDSTKQEYLDGQIMLDFDISMEDNGASGSEILKVEIWKEESWHDVASFSNVNGSFNWKSESVDITSFSLGYIFKLRFSAEGENSSNILSWFIDNIEIYHYCAPPTNLITEVFNEVSIELTWSPPVIGSDDEWIMWDDGVSVDGIGLTGGGVFSVASKWDADMITQYDDQYITKIRFVPGINAGTTTFELKVWEGANAGTLLYSQAISGLLLGEWNEIILTTAVALDVSQELWFGYTVDSPADTWPAGFDDGPAVAGYGDMISLDGSAWDPIGSLSAFDLNWNLQACVSEMDDVDIFIPMIYEPTDYRTPNATLVAGTEVPGVAVPETNSLRALIGYNVYWNEDGAGYNFLEFTEDTTYLHVVEDPFANGSIQCYYVSAVYENCEPESNEACWVFMGIEDITITDGLVVYPNPVTEIITIKNREEMQMFCLLDLNGRMMECKKLQNQTQTKLDVSTYEAGVYLLRVDTEMEQVIRKIIITR